MQKNIMVPIVSFLFVTGLNVSVTGCQSLDNSRFRLYTAPSPRDLSERYCMYK